MTRRAAVPLAPGVWRVPLLRDWVNGFVFRDEDGQVTLLDMGLRSHGPKVMAALASIGSGPSDVTRLLLTHAHPDHAGGAAHVARETGRGFGVHAADAGFARRGESPPRDPSFRLGRLLQTLGLGTRYEPVPVEEELSDGDVLPVAGGLRVVHTPGHSPGHASYLHEPTGVLVTGDALFNFRSVGWSVKAFCTDFRMSQQTAQRLAELDYTVAAFTHGPEITEGAREQVRTFLAGR